MPRSKLAKLLITRVARHANATATLSAVLYHATQSPALDAKAIKKAFAMAEAERDEALRQELIYEYADILGFI